MGNGTLLEQFDEMLVTCDGLVSHLGKEEATILANAKGFALLLL